MDRGLIYAKKLGEIGNKIIKTSNKFSKLNLDEVNNEKLKEQYDNCLKAIDRYKECKVSLNNIIPPPKVRIEHEKMVDAMKLFINGTEFMFRSIDIDNCYIDIESMNKGIILQKQGENTIVKLTDEIALKLIG